MKCRFSAVFFYVVYKTYSVASLAVPLGASLLTLIMCISAAGIFLGVAKNALAAGTDAAGK